MGVFRREFLRILTPTGLCNIYILKMLILQDNFNIMQFIIIYALTTIRETKVLRTVGLCGVLVNY